MQIGSIESATATISITVDEYNTYVFDSNVQSDFYDADHDEYDENDDEESRKRSIKRTTTYVLILCTKASFDTIVKITIPQYFLTVFHFILRPGL